MGAIFQVLAAAIVFAAAPANALLFGESAKDANQTHLKIALRMYRQGASHAKVWRNTGWFCARRVRGSCRWEPSSECFGIGYFHIIPLKHTDFTGEKDLQKVFLSRCLFTAYPQMRQQIQIRDGHCGGNFGTANHDGRVCINTELIEKYGWRGKRRAYLVLLHEIQHQIQYTEEWPARSRHDCEWAERAVEAEAVEIQHRAEWRDKKRKTTPPIALTNRDLCF